MESNKTRLLPEGVCAVYLPGGRFVKFDPSACDPKLMKKHLVFFTDERLEGLAELKKDVRFGAKLFSTTHKGYQERFSKFEMIRKLEEAKKENRLEELFEAKKPHSSTADVPGALTTREAVQAEIDALRTRFNVEQEVPARFVAQRSDIPSFIPGDKGNDAVFGFHGLPYLPAPYSMEIVFADEYLTYAKPYRDYLLLHEFAHCLQVLDNWPYYGKDEGDHDSMFREACAKLGFDPEQEGSYYLAGSYRITCQSCGDVKYAKEDETMLTLNKTMAEFVKTSKCPHCLGNIAAEPITTPVFLLGEDVFEVAPNGDCTLIGTYRKPEKSQVQLHDEYGDIVYAVASYMDFRRYQAKIERICFELDETWELYDFEDWMQGCNNGQYDEMLERLSRACDVVEEVGDEAYARMMLALRKGQRIPVQDQAGLFGFKIGEVNLADLDKEECDLFAMEESVYNVPSNFESLCKFLKEYFEVEQDDEKGVNPDIHLSQDDYNDEEPVETPDEEKVFLQVKAVLSGDGSWRRFVIPANTLFVQLHYSLAVAFDRVDDITEDFVFHAGGELLNQRDSFHEKVVDKLAPGDAAGYKGCNGISAKVTIEGLCRLDPSLPPIFPMIIGSSEDASLLQLNVLSADLAMSSEEDFVPDDPNEFRDAYIDLAARLAAQCVDPNLVRLLA